MATLLRVVAGELGVLLRGRIGLIIPSSNTTMEREFWELLGPVGFTVHAARLFLREVTARELEEMAGRVEEAARLLSTAEVDVIVYGCTTGSLVGGPGFDREISRRIEEAAGVPAVATATAVVEALRALGANRVAVATPYIDELNRLEKSFLEAHGFEIVDLKGLGIRLNTEIGRLPSWRVYRLAKSLDTSRADAVFLSCTNMPTLEVIDVLEDDLGLPVVSSNTASMWASLRLVGARPRLERGGLLLKEKL